MTITVECDSGDYVGGENLIRNYDITTEKGISVKDLKATELAACQSVWNTHVQTHPGHTGRYRFSVPEGYEERRGVIYKAKPQIKKSSLQKQNH